MRKLLSQMKWVNKGLISLVLCCLLFIKISDMAAPANAMAASCLRTSGSKILDSSDQEIGLSGLNWFGFETSSYAPHGLWARNWKRVLNQIKSQGYNVIRLPFSNEMLRPGVKPTGINYTINSDLEGLTSLQLMDKIIAGAEERGLKIILDNHRSTPGGGPEAGGLWYTNAYPESKWIADWKMLALRYKNSPAVIGVDLRNEPYGACWACGDPAKDWRLASEKAGNAILEVNPNLLIIVEGVTEYKGQYTWWGGNLMGAKEYPVRLDVPNRLVYSTHEYAETIYPQPWFRALNYPKNLPSVWDKYWGYLVRDNIAPVLVGEFGTRYETKKDQQWMQSFQKYIQTNELNWTFWSLNPDSGDTGGLLLDNWISINQEKQNILKQIQYPFIESSCGKP
jgi:endoglucanase